MTGPSRRRALHAFVAGIAFLATAGEALAAESRPVEVEESWARANRDGTITVYLDILNRREETEAITMASTPSADLVLLNQVKWHGSEPQVERLRRIPLAVHGRTSLKPGGTYLTLIGPKRGLEPGSLIHLTLSFEKSAALDIDVKLTNQMLGNRGR